MNRRVLALAALVVVGLSSVTGAGSVSSVSADRDVSVAVVEDREAYLGLEFSNASNGTVTLTVENHVRTDDLAVTVDGKTETATPGDPVEFTVDCGETVEIVGDGPGVRIEATRDVPVCSSGGTTGTA
jgi:hypothetical protein